MKFLLNGDHNNYHFLSFQIRSVYERDHLLSEIEKLQSDFDEMLMRLGHEKAHLDITMVTADIKHITQFEELVLLKEFEKRETTFTSRYKTKKSEREAMVVKVKKRNEIAIPLFKSPLSPLSPD